MEENNKTPERIAKYGAFKVNVNNDTISNQTSSLEIRLDCLRIAISGASALHPQLLSLSADQLIEDAQKIEQYVLGGEK